MIDPGTTQRSKCAVIHATFVDGACGKCRNCPKLATDHYTDRKFCHPYFFYCCNCAKSRGWTGYDEYGCAFCKSQTGRKDRKVNQDQTVQMKQDEHETKQKEEERRKLVQQEEEQKKQGGKGCVLHKGVEQKDADPVSITIQSLTNMSTSGHYYVFHCSVRAGIKDKKGVLKAAKDSNSERLLQHELDIYRKLDCNKYIVECIHVAKFSLDGQSPSFLAIVTERAKRSLADWIAESESEVRQFHKQGVAQQLGRIVSYIHQQNLVWLDVKPANFVVFKDLQIKAADFDGAGRVGTEVTRQTVNYCAPELTNRVRAPAAFLMDAWSLGMTVFEVFTGQNLYSLIGLNEPDQIVGFWKERGSQSILEGKAREVLTDSSSDTKLKHFLFGRDGVGGVLRSDPAQRSSVLQCMRERALFTDSETTTGLHRKVDQVTETLSSIKLEISELKPLIREGLDGIISQAANNEGVEKELKKLTRALSQLPRVDATAAGNSEEIRIQLDKICHVIEDFSTLVSGNCSYCLQGVSETFKATLQTCQSKQGKDQEEMLLKVLKQMGDMQKQLNNVETEIMDLKDKLEDAVTASRSAVFLLNRLCLAEADGKLAPHLIWIYPAERKKSLMSRLNPKHWIYDKVYIRFICPVSLQVCAERFETQDMKSWFKRALPYLKAALCVLQIALASAWCMGLPCPALGDQVPRENRELEAVKALSGFVMEMAVQEQINLSPIEESLNARERQQEKLDALRDDLRRSNKAVVELMENIDKNWVNKTGLRLVNARDGTVEWVHPSAADDFKRKGQKMLSM